MFIVGGGLIWMMVILVVFIFGFVFVMVYFYFWGCLLKFELLFFVKEFGLYGVFLLMVVVLGLIGLFMFWLEWCIYGDIVFV